MSLAYKQRKDSLEQVKKDAEELTLKRLAESGLLKPEAPAEAQAEAPAEEAPAASKAKK